jgi:hypothetical protein
MSWPSELRRIRELEIGWDRGLVLDSSNSTYLLIPKDVVRILERRGILLEKNTKIDLKLSNENEDTIDIVYSIYKKEKINNAK